MKKNIGSALALYPTPLTVIGAMDQNKPTWTLVAHVGIIGHDLLLVSLAKNHHINQFINETKKLSINMVSEKILPQADYVGSVSGKKVDKSEVFDYELSENGVPLIKDSPLVIECEVIDNYDANNGFDNYIVKFTNTFVEEENLNDKGKIDYHQLKPVLFEFPTYEYLKTGEVLGKCLSFKEDK